MQLWQARHCSFLRSFVPCHLRKTWKYCYGMILVVWKKKRGGRAESVVVTQRPLDFRVCSALYGDKSLSVDRIQILCEDTLTNMARVRNFEVKICQTDGIRTYGRWGLKDGEGKPKIETCGGEYHRSPRLTKGCRARWWWWRYEETVLMEIIRKWIIKLCNVVLTGFTVQSKMF